MSVTMAVTLLSHHQPSIQDNVTQESTVQPMWKVTITTTMGEALVADDSKTLIKTGEIINQDKILQTTCHGQVT